MVVWYYWKAVVETRAEIDIQGLPYRAMEVAAALGVCFGWEPGATLGGLRAAVGAAGGTPRAEFLQLIYERNARSI